ncbi:MAG: hypothetical protein CVU97_02370 [Firmicutes bacterium HGW-Firmicutes-21]|nr:MAG: hypothetical protein CVU97_02370 [Firmicutes bacterium HGW-Firmicutes-21]
MTIIKRISIILLAVTLLFLSACSGKSNDEESMPEGTKKAANEAVDYYFYYPSNWVLDRNDGMISIRYNTSLSSKFETYASVSVISFTLSNPNQRVNEYWEENVDDIKQTFGVEDIYAEKETTLSGVVAARKEYKGSLGDTAVNFAQIICIRKGVVYLVTFTASEADYNATVGAFETVIGNFHFE